MVEPGAAETAVCRMLRGDLLPHQLDQSSLQTAWDYGTFASADELLAQLLVDARPPVPEPIASQAASRLRDAHARELMRFSMLRELTTAFAAAGLRALLMKGGGLAYTVYPAAHLRPSDDVDVLIAPDSLARADAALRALGYGRQIEPDVTLASTQRHYALVANGGFERVVDLHWATTNRHSFLHVLAFESAWADSRPVPALGGARTLGPVDALLLACTHRVAHHADSPSLLWLWDIHLLVSTLTPVEVVVLVQRAERARVAAVVAHSLRMAEARFATAVDPAISARLRAATGEPSAAFIDGARRPVDWLVSDLAASGSLTRRLRLLREHLLPPLVYMRQKYAAWPGALLPLAYVHRALRGAPKWFRNG